MRLSQISKTNLMTTVRHYFLLLLHNSPSSKESIHVSRIRGDGDSIPGSGRSPKEGNGNTLQYSLGNPMDRGVWQATVYLVAKESDRTE